MVGPSILDVPCRGNGLCNVLWQKRQRSSISSSNNKAKRRDAESSKRRSVMLMDMDILDCPVCFEPFTIPIFQCENGHLACSSCCPKLGNKCPACNSLVGHNRCRPMETVLESVLVPCRNFKFGCTKNFTYGKESTHEKECIFSQIACPLQECNYTGSYNDLYDLSHLKGCYWEMFSCDITYRIHITEDVLIKKEHTNRLLFAVQVFKKLCGVYVTVSCISPPALEVGEFSYDLSYIVDGYTMTFKSPKVKRIQKLSFQIPKENFMLIPHNLYRDDLEMELCIRKLNQQ